MTELNVFATGGSSWVVETMKKLEIKTAACGNVTGGSYVETPPIIKPLKRSILSVFNRQYKFCFLYCLAAENFSFLGRPHSPKIHEKIERLSSNPKLMPMPLSAVPTFEKRNRCSINVYQLEKSKLVSMYHSKNRKRRHKNSHYCLIKNISNMIHFLCRSKLKQNKGSKSRFCRNCFQLIVEPNFEKHGLFLRDFNAYRVAICPVC